MSLCPELDRPIKSGGGSSTPGKRSVSIDPSTMLGPIGPSHSCDLEELLYHAGGKFKTRLLPSHLRISALTY